MITSPDQFIGGTFAWFTGVVEDINDPFQLGRIKVRCIGYHTDDKGLIATSDLPWATPMMPVNSASMSGIGISATGILQGSWVVGFFRDGPSAQDPIILGTIPSSSVKLPDKSKGFSDPDGKYPLELFVTNNFPDTPTEAINGANKILYSEADAYKKRVALLQDKVITATAPRMTLAKISDKDSYIIPTAWKSWEIKTVISPQYPKNQVFHSESGHVFEVDDTPDKERTLDYHKSGTYKEIDAQGNETTTVVGDKYTVVMGDENVYIKGNKGKGGYRLTVEGNVRQYVKGDYHLEVTGNKTEYIHGHRQSKIDGTDHLDTKKYLETVETSLSGHPSAISSNGGNPVSNGSVASVTSSGFQVNFASINLNGNVNCLNGASDSFTTVDGKTVTVAKGVIVNII